MLKKILKIIGVVVGLTVLAVAGTVAVVASRFDASMAKVYAIPAPPLAASSDPTVIERGRHLAESAAGCAASDCHGSDLAGGKTIAMGPLGRFTAPNITPAGVAAHYSDGELARLILHGVRRDGHSLRFMPAHEINWLPDDDLVAVISYVRSVPAVEKPNGPIEIGLMGKLMDRFDMAKLDIARRIDHLHRVTAPTAEPTALYGAFLAQACRGCHGEHLSGGRIPGTPPETAIPANLTPDATGLRDWTFADFENLLATGVRPDGRKLDPMMPVEMLNRLNETEKQALWAYLQSLPPRPFGER